LTQNPSLDPERKPSTILTRS